MINDDEREYELHRKNGELEKCDEASKTLAEFEKSFKELLDLLEKSSEGSETAKMVADHRLVLYKECSELAKNLGSAREKIQNDIKSLNSTDGNEE